MCVGPHSPEPEKDVANLYVERDPLLHMTGVHCYLTESGNKERALGPDSADSVAFAELYDFCTNH